MLSKKGVPFRNALFYCHSRESGRNSGACRMRWSKQPVSREICFLLLSHVNIIICCPAYAGSLPGSLARRMPGDRASQPRHVSIWCQRQCDEDEDGDAPKKDEDGDAPKIL